MTSLYDLERSKFLKVDFRLARVQADRKIQSVDDCLGVAPRFADRGATAREDSPDGVDQARLVGGEAGRVQRQAMARPQPCEVQRARPRSPVRARRIVLLDRPEHLESGLGKEVLDASGEELAIERVDEGAHRLDVMGSEGRRGDLGRLECLAIHVASGPRLARLRRSHL